MFVFEAKSLRAIARYFGVNHVTVQNWKKTEVWKKAELELVEQLKDELNKITVDLAKTTCEAAKKQLEKMRESETTEAETMQAIANAFGIVGDLSYKLELLKAERSVSEKE
ncbi:MAG: hypothetical protein J7647_30865 [Cyanobacteria bacterium SBLK]|nr:hypothetical protein [Cyanobacteria bacterium SBLK]